MANSADNTQLTIISTAIRRDAEGRYCLNDCHKASGGDASKKPSEWLRNAQAQALIAEMAENCQSGNSRLASVNVIKGGSAPGVFVVKELVYAYAMWINPTFHLQVIRAFDAFQQLQSPHVAVAALDADVRRIMGGVTKAVMSKALDDRLAPMEAAIMTLSNQLSTLVIEHDPRVAAVEYVSVRRLLDEAKVPPKGRNSLNRKLGNALRDLVLQTNASARRSPETSVWLFPTDMAHKFMRHGGRDLVAQHMEWLAEKMGQSVLRFPRGNKA